MKKNHNKPNNFEIIKGDLPLSPILAKGDFVMAEATDTRLMGVVGLHIERENQDGPFHQLFYLDFEEYGIDDYRSFQLSASSPYTLQDVKREMADLFGGLGGSWVKVNEKESMFLIKEAYKLNDEEDDYITEDFDDYLPVLETPIYITPEEERIIWSKICVTTQGDYEVINYFIMRHTAMDEAGEKYLTRPERPFNLFTMTEPGTLYRNEINPTDKGNNIHPSTNEYISTSLISDDKGFRLLMSEVSTKSSKVATFDIKQDMRISPWEASLIMARTEYVSVFKSHKKDLCLVMSSAAKSIFPGADLNAHPGGNLLMIYKDDNSHVNQKIYRLDEDTRAAIYICYNDELIIAGSNLRDLYSFERVMTDIASRCGSSLKEVGRYAFPETTLGHYVNNEYGTFSSFLDYIQFLTDRD